MKVKVFNIEAPQTVKDPVTGKAKTLGKSVEEKINGWLQANPSIDVVGLDLDVQPQGGFPSAFVILRYTEIGKAKVK